MPKIKTKPRALKKGDTRVLINGLPPMVDCRIVSEELYQKLKNFYEKN